MTVKMLTAWNGYPKDYIGSVISPSEEARLVGIGFASYDLDGVDNDNVRLPVTATTNPLTGGMTLFAGGVTSVQTNFGSILRGNSRIRTATPISYGETLFDFDADQPAGFGVIFGDGYARGSLVTLPDGRRKWAIKLNTPFGSGKETFVAINLASLSRVMASTDVIEIQVYSPDGSIPRAYIGGNSTPAVAWRYISVNMVGSLSYVRRTGVYTLKIPLSYLTQVGGIVSSDLITKIHITTSNSGARGRDTYVMGKVVLNRRETSRVIVSSDDGLVENLWLADSLAARGLKLTAYIIPSLIGTGGFLSESQLSQLAAKPNVQIANHSYSHTYVNGGPTGTVWGSSVTGVCLSQAVAAGALLLNGAIGVSFFDRPRHITFVTSSINSGVRVDVVGEFDGVSKSEVIYLGEASGYPFPTHNVWDKITSLTVSVPSGSVAAGNITVGTSCSYDEILCDIRRGFDYLESRGYSNINNRHYAAPQGQSNDTLFKVLEDLGVKTCRLTDPTTFAYSSEHDAYKYPAIAIEEAAQPSILQYLTLANAIGESMFLYIHQIKTDNSTPAAGGIRASTLTTILDMIPVGGGTASDMYEQTTQVF